MLSEMFKTMCKGLGEQAEVVEHLSTTFFGMTIPNYIKLDEIRLRKQYVEGKPYLHNWQVMLAEVNLDLLDKMESGQVEDALKHLSFQDIHVSELKHRLMEENVTDSPEERFKKHKALVCDEIISQRLKNSVKRTVAGPRDKFDEKSTYGEDKQLTGVQMRKLVLNSFNEILGADCDIDQTVLRRIENLEVINAHEFVADFLQKVEENWPKSFHDKYGIWNGKWKDKYFPAWTDVEKTLSFTGTKKPYCPTRCPLCAAPCMFSEDHEENHDCFHQPKGLVGWFWEDSKVEDSDQELVYENCVQLVTRGGRYKFQGEYYPYKKFCEHFPTWNLPKYPEMNQKSSNYNTNGEFRTMFFQKYQKELAEKYNKKKCSTISKQVVDFTDIRQALNKIRRGNKVERVYSSDR